MEIQISQELYYILKGIMVIGLLGLISVVGLIINAIIQVTRDIENNKHVPWRRYNWNKR